MGDIKKPLPIPDGDSKPFWDGCKEEKLLIQQCQDCKKNIFYPRAICPGCFSDNIEWIESKGKGKVYSFTIARRPASPAFADDVPYVVALVDLDEGVRMLTNIVNVDVNVVYCDMPVEVCFQTVEEMKLPMFAPIEK